MSKIRLKTLLLGDTIKLDKFEKLNNLIGKNVIISIEEDLTEEGKVKKTNSLHERNWNYLGTVNFGEKIDKVNLRDIAYDENID